jgi:hypothetical protein
MVTDKPKKTKGSGWRKISSPEDLQSSLVTMLNKILMSDDPLSHAGRFRIIGQYVAQCEEAGARGRQQRLSVDESWKKIWSTLRRR